MHMIRTLASDETIMDPISQHKAMMRLELPVGSPRDEPDGSILVLEGSHKNKEISTKCVSPESLSQICFSFSLLLYALFVQQGAKKMLEHFVRNVDTCAYMHTC